MPVLELVRPRIEDKTPTTETEELLERDPQRFESGGSTQDSSVTVIENSIVDGHIGYLFAAHFSESPVSRFLKEVAHFRLSVSNFEITETADYDRVEIEGGFSPGVRFKYDFLTARNGQITLPRPTILPYEIAFFEPQAYQRLLEGMRNEKSIKDTVGQVNRLLVQKVRTFSLQPDSQLLILPSNYAALMIHD